MIRRFFCALFALALLSGGAQGQTWERALVRLHVVAADDGEAAQALKLEVRDTCLDCARACLAGARSADEAWAHLEANLPKIEAACAARARELGCTEPLRAELGVFAFPERTYGQLRVPAGDYRALRVTIGAGAGRNWWCVLYPSLCALGEAGADSGELDLRAALDWLRARLGGAA